MVDQELLDRLLDRAGSDLKALAGYRASGDLLEDPTRLGVVKYHFITTIEGCVRISHHIIASEGWRIADSNADAVRALGAQHVVLAPTAEAVARAVGFRNELIYDYVDVDDAQVRDHLEQLAHFQAFISQVAVWSAD
ncbi:MAG: HepT-like ribonuclease domain-containing protein [Pseudonocardiaceae bacterium]